MTKKKRRRKTYHACTNALCGKPHPGTTRLCANCYQKKRRYGDENADFRRPPNTQCQALVPGGCPKKPRGTYCAMHARRNRLYGNPLLTAKDVRQSQRKPLCSSPECGREGNIHGRCDRCDKRWRRGTLGRPFEKKHPKLCGIEWCSRRGKCLGYCFAHGSRLKENGHPLMTRRHGFEQAPEHCTRKGCGKPLQARGLCLEDLKRSAKTEPLLVPYLPTFVGPGTCFEKVGCRQRATLWGRCPECLHTWRNTV